MSPKNSDGPVCLGDPAIYSGRAFGLIELYMRHSYFFFLGDCACIYHIDTYTDTYIRALHIDLQ